MRLLLVVFLLTGCAAKTPPFADMCTLKGGVLTVCLQGVNEDSAAAWPCCRYRKAVKKKPVEEKEDVSDNINTKKR
jgi:hypothetical protein